MIKEIMFKWQDLEAKYMDKSWQYAEGEERGLEKGRSEGRAEGIFNLISALLSLKAGRNKILEQLKTTYKLTEDEALDWMLKYAKKIESDESHH